MRSAAPQRRAAERVGPIALTWDAARVRAVQLVRTRRGSDGRPRFTGTAATLRRPAGAGLHPDAPEVDAIAQMLRRRRFRGGKAILGACAEQLIATTLELSAREAADPEASVTREIERIWGLEPGGYELAAWPAPSGPPGVHRPRRSDPGLTLLVHALPHTHALRQIAACPTPRLAAVDTAAWGLARLTAAAGWTGAGLALRLGPDASSLALIEDGVVGYERPLLDAGLDQPTGQLARLGFSDRAARRILARHAWDDAGRMQIGPAACDIADAYTRLVASEVLPVIRWAAARGPHRAVRRAALVDAGAGCRGLAAALSQRLALPLAPLVASAGITGITPDGTPASRAHAGANDPDLEAHRLSLDAWAVNVGLALPRETRS